MHHVAEHDRGVAVEADAPELTGNDLGLRVEHGEAQRARVDAPRRVGAEIVPSRDAVDVEHGALLVALADVDQVATGAHDPAVFVDRDAADAAPLRDHRGHRAGGVDSVDASAEHVGEDERSVDVDRRRFREPVAVRDHVPVHRATSLGRVLRLSGESHLAHGTPGLR